MLGIVALLCALFVVFLVYHGELPSSSLVASVSSVLIGAAVYCAVNADATVRTALLVYFVGTASVLAIFKCRMNSEFGAHVFMAYVVALEYVQISLLVDASAHATGLAYLLVAALLANEFCKIGFALLCSPILIGCRNSASLGEYAALCVMIMISPSIAVYTRLYELIIQ